MGTIPVITDQTEQDFLDGVLEVYDEIFSKKVPFYFLDVEASKVNSYGETTNKVYKDPVYLTARVVVEAKEGEKAVNRPYSTAKISVPTQNLWDNGLATEEEDLTIKTLSELKELAKRKGIKGYSSMKKEELLKALK